MTEYPAQLTARLQTELDCLARRLQVARGAFVFFVLLAVLSAISFFPEKGWPALWITLGLLAPVVAAGGAVIYLFNKQTEAQQVLAHYEDQKREARRQDQVRQISFQNHATFYLRCSQEWPELTREEMKEVKALYRQKIGLTYGRFDTQARAWVFNDTAVDHAVRSHPAYDRIVALRRAPHTLPLNPGD